MSDSICYQWQNTNISWINANWKWSECFSPLSVFYSPDGVDATTLIQPWNPYKEENKKRLIELICKINGEIYKEKKLFKESKVSVNDIKIILDSKNIKITMENNV